MALTGQLMALTSDLENGSHPVERERSVTRYLHCGLTVCRLLPASGAISTEQSPIWAPHRHMPPLSTVEASQHLTLLPLLPQHLLLRRSSPKWFGNLQTVSYPMPQLSTTMASFWTHSWTSWRSGPWALVRSLIALWPARCLSSLEVVFCQTPNSHSQTQ